MSSNTEVCIHGCCVLAGDRCCVACRDVCPPRVPLLPLCPTSGTHKRLQVRVSCAHPRQNRTEDPTNVIDAAMVASLLLLLLLLPHCLSTSARHLSRHVLGQPNVHNRVLFGRTSQAVGGQTCRYGTRRCLGRFEHALRSFFSGAAAAGRQWIHNQKTTRASDRILSHSAVGSEFSPRHAALAANASCPRPCGMEKLVVQHHDVHSFMHKPSVCLFWGAATDYIMRCCDAYRLVCIIKSDKSQFNRNLPKSLRVIFFLSLSALKCLVASEAVGKKNPSSRPLNNNNLNTAQQEK